MYRSRQKLPPLATLPAFEASARLLSFTRAGEELYLSQAGVSQKIRALEDNLGIKLFERTSRGIRLTEQGQRFQHSIAVALDLVENATKDIRTQEQSNDLTIAADISMAHLWLLPRFPKFREEYPDISVSVLASEHEEDCLRDSNDLALLYGNGNWPGFDADMLIQEEVFPVCSPVFQEKHCLSGNLGELSNAVLLDLKGDRWDWVDWGQLLTANGLPAPDTTQFFRFNSLPLLIQAALRGQGIGLGWGSLVDDLIADGLLVKPYDISLRTDRGYFVIKRANVRMSAKTKVLFDWVIRNKQTKR